jgi:N-acetylneuraminate lyase
MDRTIFHGIFTPVVSPCDQDDGFLFDFFESNADRVLQTGVQGLYVCGGTGDAQFLRVPERERALKIAVSLAHKYQKHVIAHVGGASQRDAIELAEHAAKAGADAIASIPSSSFDQSKTVAYYRDLSLACGLPVFVYNFPAATHRAMSLEELLELLSIPGVMGIKMTDWNLFLMRRVLLERPDAVVYNGYDELAALGMLYGAQGSIGTWSNLMPELYVAIYNHIQSGNAQAAIELQKALIDFLNAAWKVGVMEAFEALMRELGYAPRCFRKPYSSVRVPAEAIPPLRARMDEALAKAREK